jgi:predicted DNA-binding transcriptional regulator YafY
MPKPLNPEVTQAERVVRAAWHLFHGGIVTSAWLRESFGVSSATAKRDLLLLKVALPVSPDGFLVRRGVARRMTLGGRRVVSLLGAD